MLIELQNSQEVQKNSETITNEHDKEIPKERYISPEEKFRRSNLCDYRDAYILVKGTITVENKVAQDQPSNAANEKVIFKNCALFSNCISRVNNTQVDDAHECQCTI